MGEALAGTRVRRAFLLATSHQPLHAADRENDQGGNKVFISFAGKRTDGSSFKLTSEKLHAVWDSDLIAAQAYNWGDLAQQIEASEAAALSATPFNATEVAGWANDSHKIAEGAYADLPSGTPLANSPTTAVPLPQSYFDKYEPVVRSQLALGGVRLADVLNFALGGAP